MKTHFQKILPAIVLFVLSISLQAQNLSMQLIGEKQIGLPAVPQKAIPYGSYCYLAAKGSGLQVYDITNVASPTLTSTIPVSALENLEVMNIYRKADRLYLALGNFFGNNGQQSGLAVVNIANAASPVVEDVWKSGIQDKGSASVVVEGDYAYLCAMSQGLIILDVSQPDDIAFVSQYIPNPDFPTPNPAPAQAPNARGLAIRDDIVYLCYDAGGLRVINVADKTNPVETGRYINPAFSNKQQAFNNITLHGNTAFVAVDYCGMEVLDIADTANIVQVSWWNPWECQSPSNIWVGSPGHTNQIDYNAECQLVFISSAQSELSVIDVAVPTAPELVGSYGSTDDQQGTWGMTLDSNRIYLVYITAVIPFVSNWAGIRILEWGKTSKAIELPRTPPLRLYPNPARHSFQLEYDLTEYGEISLEMTNIQGKVTKQILQEYQSAGLHSLAIVPQLPTGTYLLRLITANATHSIKVVLVEE